MHGAIIALLSIAIKAHLVVAEAILVAGYLKTYDQKLPELP
jgi:hypothetical protein